MCAAKKWIEMGFEKSQEVQCNGIAAIVWNDFSTSLNGCILSCENYGHNPFRLANIVEIGGRKPSHRRGGGARKLDGRLPTVL